MANSKSAEKRVRQTEKRTARNKAVRSKFNNEVKRFEEAVINEENKEVIEQRLQSAIKTIDKTAAKGIIHENKAARVKSRLMKKFNNLN
ncbi:MAG: 30S ribosomal protein S20 [Clostridia bacterium]